jgi:hypothetical protein
LFQNSELLTVLDTQLLAVQREERQTKKWQKLTCCQRH